MNRAVPQKALRCDNDLVGLPAPAAHDGGAGLDPACGLSLAAGEPVEEELGLRREPAPDLLLEPVGHCPDQEITAEGAWGRAPVEPAVDSPRGVGREPGQAGEG